MRAPAGTRFLRQIPRISCAFGLLSGLLACTAELGGLGGASPGGSADAGEPLLGDGSLGRPGTDSGVLDAGFADAAAFDATIGSCDGFPNGSTQRMAGYTASVVRAPATQCNAGEQTRQCVDGKWSAWQGLFVFDTCSVEGHASCDGQPHGTVQTKVVFSVASASSAANCAAAKVNLTRTCDEGVWGAFTDAPVGSVTACSVALAGGCVAVGDLAAFSCAVGSQCSGLAGRCVVGVGEVCTANTECADTCVGGVCTALRLPGGTCDDAADCTGCTAGAACITGTCKCNDLSACAANRDCAHTCRGGACTKIGVACDANDQEDCGSFASCHVSSSFWLCFSDIGAVCSNDNQCQGLCLSSTQTCAAPSLLSGPCDNDADCDDSASKCSANVCLGDSGDRCTAGAGCASAVCQGVTGGSGFCK